MKKSNTVKITVVGIMTAISTVIYMIFPEIPLVPGVEYLKMDFSDIPAILTGVILGPIGGITVEIIKNIIHLFRTTTFGIGELMNVGICSSMILSFTLFLRLFSKIFKKNSLNPAPYFISAAVAIIITVLAGWFFNGILTPVYFKLAGIPVTTATVMAGVWGSTLLNTIKAAFNLLPFYPVYLAAHKTFTKINR